MDSEMKTILFNLFILSKLLSPLHIHFASRRLRWPGGGGPA